mgnify:CR=1 FL=1
MVLAKCYVSKRGSKGWYTEKSWRREEYKDLENQWIPNNPSGRPTTIMPEKGEEQKVKDLISNFKWNRNEVYRRFTREDAENILNY